MIHMLHAPSGLAYSSRISCLFKHKSCIFKEWQVLKSTFRLMSTKKSLIGKDFIVKSMYPDLKLVEGVTVPEFVWASMSRIEHAPAFECYNTGVKYTHGDIYKKSRAFAAALIHGGLERGDCVMVDLPNIPEYPICVFGIMHAGGICTTADPTCKPLDSARQMLISGAKMAITTPGSLPTIRAIKANCPAFTSVIVIGETHAGCHTFSEMLKTDPDGVEFLKGSQIDTEKTVALLPFSSGTTGPPKGVQLTHANICTNMLQYTYPDFACINKLQDGLPAEKVLGVLPFFHIYALSLLLVAHYAGIHVLTMPRFQPNVYIESLRKFKPTILPLVPPLVQLLANCPEVVKQDLESVKSIQVAGAPTGVTLLNKLLEKFDKSICIQEMYGLSETSPVATMMNPSWKHTKLGSCGTLVPGTLGRIVELDRDDQLLGPNLRGELHLKGPQIMIGYYKNIVATRQCIDEQNWFHTGDIAYYDEDGCFYVVDRLKDVIKVRGFQVAPAELEDLLRQKPEIADVAVVGIKDARSGELPRAYIVKRSESLTEADVYKFLEGKISKHKRLKGGIEFVHSIPKSPSGKILRRELRPKT